jgi:hypothetical protein
MTRHPIYSIVKFFTGLLLAGALTLPSNVARATTAFFDFSNDGIFVGTPLTNSDNGVTATFSSPDDPDALIVVPAEDAGFATLGPHALVSDPAIQLDISFSVPVQTIAFNFATVDFYPPYSILQVQAFDGSTPVASAFSDGAPQYPGDFSEGFLGLGASSFDNVVLSTFNGNNFAIGNLEVTTNAVAPETTSLLSLGIVLLLSLTGTLYGKRKSMVRPPR